MSQTSQDRALIQDISREIIGEVAPEESDLFDQLADEYFNDPRPPNLNAKATDDALGFGLGDVLIASTPAATAMVTIVITFVVQLLMTAATDESSDLVRKKLRALFRRGGSAADAPTFTTDQLRQMRSAAEAEARRFGLSEAEAQAMADAMFRRMVLGQ